MLAISCSNSSLVFCTQTHYFRKAFCYPPILNPTQFLLQGVLPHWGFPEHAQAIPILCHTWHLLFYHLSQASISPNTAYVLGVLGAYKQKVIRQSGLNPNSDTSQLCDMVEFLLCTSVSASVKWAYYEYLLHRVLWRFKKMVYVKDLRQHLAHNWGSISICVCWRWCFWKQFRP